MRQRHGGTDGHCYADYGGQRRRANIGSAGHRCRAEQSAMPARSQQGWLGSSWQRGAPALSPIPECVRALLTLPHLRIPMRSYQKSIADRPVYRSIEREQELAVAAVPNRTLVESVELDPLGLPWAPRLAD